MERTKTDRKNMVPYIIILILLVVICFGGWYMMGMMQSNAPEEAIGGDLMAKMNKITEIPESDRQAAVNQLVDDGEINVTYASKAEFDGNVSTLFTVRNIENNHYPVVFSIYDENGDEIYHSVPIEPGYEITSISLDEPLDAGVHQCKIMVGYDGEGNVRTTFPLQITVE